MAMSQSPRTAPRKSRKSIANIPTSTVANDENLARDAAAAKAAARKTRSRSLGPGGLEALTETTGNRQKIPPVVKSILKPSIPLSPLKPIPSHSSLRKGSPSKSRPGSSPVKPGPRSKLGQSGLEAVPNPFDIESPRKATDSNEGKSVSLKSEEEQQAAARERERKEIIERRDARRKSLANRRVSFAPEATLHTWDVVELPEDATSSSEATNSTRRASAASSLPTSPYPQGEQVDGDPDSTELPSTPSGEEIQVAASPASQREMHKKRRRRSSKVSSMDFGDSNDLSSSPISSLGSDDTSQSFATAEGSVIDGSDSDSDRDLVAADDTVTGMNDDITSHSGASTSSLGQSSTTSSGRLDEALRQATFQAANQDVMLDTDGDVSMEMADQEVTNAFRPWARQSVPNLPSVANQMSLLDQDDLDPFLYDAKNDDGAGNADEEMTMEMTQAMGGILSREQPPQTSPTQGRRKSAANLGRRGSAGRRRSSGGSSAMADETMELTTAFGTIKQAPPQPIDDVPQSVIGDEDMSMELTTVIGAGIKALNSGRRESESSFANDDEMDISAPIRRVLSPVTERTEPTDEETMGMDITTAMGAILPDGLKTDDRHMAKLLMEEEADHGQLTRSPFAKPESQASGQAKDQDAESSSLTPSKSGSPSKAGAGSNTFIVRQSPRVRTSPRHVTPVKKPATPSRQITPKADRPSTPSKTPPNKNVAMRRTSPKRLFKPDSKSPAAKSPKSPKQTPNKLEFKHDKATGSSIPSIVLTPKQRRPSGIGVDQVGMGSPKVAELLDRRASIGETASEFTPQKKTGGVRFEDPRILEQQLEKERAEEQRRESGRGIMQMETDAGEPEKDITANLKGMIESLTPKKNKLRGRKSLHVGAAKGLLGKRPAELDEDDEDGSPNKYQNMGKSPVKGIHLPAPPSKEETTGRLSRMSRASLSEIAGNVSTPVTQPTPNAKATTPKEQGRFRDAEVVKSVTKPPVSLNEQLAGVAVKAESDEDDRIHLADFLNMTSIRFMELTTTKRRHTVAPNQESQIMDGFVGVGAGSETGNKLADCVTTGACTVPMLELYQHSCRELKRYIAEGRDIVKEIENDTFEENPPLFREYLSAPPEIRAIMDNQFKNVKTHARLLSKAMWYEWRMKLLDGLKEGLVRIGDDMASDDALLARQEALLDPVVPDLVQKHDELEARSRRLQSHADELASCDQAELETARDQIVALDDEITQKRKQVEEMQAQLKETEERAESVEQRKVACRAEIKEAERVREECRGWSASEVVELKARVDAIESKHGWAIASASGPGLTLTYHNALSLFVQPENFHPHADPASLNGPISLTLANPPALTSSSDEAVATSARFFLQLLRAHLLAIPQSRTPLRSVLSLVAAGHALSTSVAAQIDALRNACFPTEVSIVSDTQLEVKARVVLRATRTVVEARFTVHASTESGKEEIGMGAWVAAEAKVVYGEELKERRMGEFLMEKVAGQIGGWAEAVGELEARLVAKARKAASA